MGATAIAGAVAGIAKGAVGLFRDKAEGQREVERARIEKAGSIRIAAMRMMSGFVVLYIVGIWTAPVVVGFVSVDHAQAMVDTMRAYPEWYQNGYMAVSAAALGLKSLRG